MSSRLQSGRAWARGVVLVLVLAVIVGVAWVWHDFVQFSRTPLRVDPQAPSFDVVRGNSLRDIVAELHKDGYTHAPTLYWRALALQLRVGGRLHAGEYAVSAGLTPTQLLANMMAGKVLRRNFTIVDGWTFQQVKQALAAAPKLKHDAQAMDEATITQQLGIPDSHPEGWFLPETYAYVKGDSELDLLRRAHEAMAKTLETLWAQRDPRLPLAQPYDALILASIVEKETGRADERARIAGVFVRRLQDHILLQTDPSVIYGMGSSYTGNIHKSDLTNDTPYNTYTRAGLPPTPIAMPGKPALQAALHPAPGDELYFVAKGDGSHVFARTLEEHNRNVACYQLKHCQ